MDFSNAKMHSSITGFFMSPGREKSPKQIYEDACAKVIEWQAKYNALGDRLQGMAKGKNTQQKVIDWQAKVIELEPTKNDEPLPRTAKSYLKKYYAYLKYGKWSASLDKGNKYTNKGKLAEEDSIDLVSRLDKKLLQKNEIRIENEFLTGVPDIFLGPDILQAEYVYDVKTSWDIETFFDNLDKDLNPLYWWQMQCYLALTNCKAGEVSYCLVNTPDSLLNEEKFYLLKRFDVISDEDPRYKEAEKELVNNMTFDDIPMESRRLKFTVERDDEAIERIYKRVKLCREYLTLLQELHAQGTFDAKTLHESEDSEEFATLEAN